jgi:GNAT superfamily N-acetyltransferase
VVVHTTSVIRLGAAADYPAAATVYRRASLSNAGDRENLVAHPEHLILAPDALAEGRTYVAEQDGCVVGFATWIETGSRVELEDLFIDPNWRKRGIARALVLRIVDVLRVRGVSCLEVTANPHALGFYRNVGFIDIGDAQTEFGAAPRMALLIP